MGCDTWLYEVVESCINFKWYTVNSQAVGIKLLTVALSRPGSRRSTKSQRLSTT